MCLILTMVTWKELIKCVKLGKACRFIVFLLGITDDSCFYLMWSKFSIENLREY